MVAFQDIKFGDGYSNLFILGSVMCVGFYISNAIVSNIREGKAILYNLLYPLSFITLCFATYHILFINDEYYQSI